MENNNKRHILKSITWRVIASVTTFIISYTLTGSVEFGIGIGVADFFIKMFLYYFHERFWYKKVRFKKIMKNNLFKQDIKIKRADKEILYDQQPKVLWFSGLSGSGKSAIANEVEKILYEMGKKTYILDGDNVRLGLNNDLSFSGKDREENIRRVAEVSKLFVNSGIITITSFISPYKKTRQMAKDIIGDDDYIEIYVNTSLEKCIERDVKGLYKKAQNGKIKGMTGIDDPYEIPQEPDIVVYGNIDGEENIKKCAQEIVKKLIK